MMDLASILRKLHGGEVVSIPPGVYEGGAVLRAPKVTLRAQPGTVFIRNGGPYNLKLDGAHGATVDGLNLIASHGHGLMAVNCRGLTFLNLVADDNGTNGILTGSCSSVLVRDCKTRRNGSHGIYLSEKGADYHVEANVSTANHRCGLQANAHPGGARNLVLIGNDLSANLNAGAQLAGITGGEIRDNNVAGNRTGIILWTDSAGKAFACHDLDCRNQPGSYVVSKWCTGIRLPPGVSPGRPEGE